MGMSGGVDSSVSAALLQRRGFNVVGGFIKNWSDSKDVWTGECNWSGERRDALRVAAKLGIPLLTFDFEKEYRALVMKDFFRTYKKGETPNPDILCNQYIKFGLFFKMAKRLKMDYIATGHYARVRWDSNGTAHLLRGADTDKDQSYFLCRISQEALNRTFFPIGNLKKTAVRKLAKQFALPVADKPDSQGICFVGKLDLKDFLRTKIKSKPGEIVDPKGRIIGRHDGLDRYTIGQRHGFAASGGTSAWYVARKDLRKNCLIVVPGARHPWLYSDSAVVRDVHWLGVRPPAFPIKVQVQIRYRQKPVSAIVASDKYKNRVKLKFTEPVKAAAAGQSAVFYKGQECLGGGFLC